MIPRPLRVALPLALALLAVACDAAPSPTPTPAPSLPASPAGDPSEGGFRGVVTDSEGQPIDGALVTIEQADFFGSATTSEDGRFQALGVSGTFTIRVVDAGYEPAFRRVEVPPGELVELEFVLEPEES